MDIIPQLFINALITGSLYALASSGLSLTYGLLRILNFAHGHLMMLGVYFFYWLTVQLGLSMLPAALGTCVFAAVAATLALHVFVLPFLRYSYLLTFITTLALATMLESIVSMLFGVNVKSLSAGAGAESVELWGVYITPVQIIIIMSALVLLTLLALVIHHTSFGRKVRAISENRDAAQALGISERRISLAVMITGTLLAAYTGILVGYETNMQPTMGTTYTIKAFAAMILGGLGNLWGTIAGSFILGFIENFSIGLDLGSWSVPAGYKDAFAFTIILVVLLVRPEGLFNRRQRRT